MSERAWENYRMASPPPLCPHGTPYAQPCNGCGWVCPTCKRSYAPWVRECNYRHGKEQGSPQFPLNIGPILPVPDPRATAASLNLPPEMAEQGRQRHVRITRQWAEVFPGLQCCSDGDDGGTGAVFLRFRLTPHEADNDPGPIEVGR